MIKTSTIFLRVVVWLLGLLGLLFWIGFVPAGIRQEWDTNLAPILWGMYVAVVPFYVALHSTLKLLQLIDKNKAFTQAAVTALQRVKFSVAIVGAAGLLALPYFYYVADIEDAPGVLLVGLILAATPTVLVVFTAVLQKLFQNAIDIKQENDLTV